MPRSSHLRRVATDSDPAKGRLIVADDGGRAEIVDGGIELRDREGLLLLRYRAGALEVAPADGDLVFRAPSGSIRFESASDISLAASGDLRLEGARGAAGELRSSISLKVGGTEITGNAVGVRARHATTTATVAEVIAGEVRTTAKSIVEHARSIETTADKVTLRAKALAQHVAGLFDARAGRVRSLVRGAFSLSTQSVTMRSEEDTSIDGRRVLLG